MKDDVEEFLRRVAQMRAAAEAQARGQQPAAAPRLAPAQPPRLVDQPPPRLVPVRETAAYEEPAEAQVVDAELAESSDRLARRVAGDFRGTEAMAEHARRLGEQVDAADDKLEAHLHQVFDHRLGRLKETVSTSDT